MFQDWECQSYEADVRLRIISGIAGWLVRAQQFFQWRNLVVATRAYT